MSNLNRRNFFSLLGASAAGLTLSQTSAAQTQTSKPAVISNEDRIKQLITASRERLKEKYFPNVELITHEGKKVRFYDDLIKDKIITLNFMYATCDGVCPGITRNLVKAQQMMGDIVGRDVFMYSITLKPTMDTPEVLADHARMMNIKPGWLFLTGKPEDIELIRIKQRFVDPDPEVDKDKSQHIGNVRFGNEPMQTWGACPGLGKPEIVVESLLWLDEGLKAKYESQKLKNSAPSSPDKGTEKSRKGGQK